MNVCRAAWVRSTLTLAILAVCFIFASVVDAGPFPRKYGAAATIDGIPLITAGGTAFKVTPTLAAGDVKISKDGGTLTNIATLPVVTPSGDRLLRITLSPTEMEAARIVVLLVDAAGAEWEDQLVIVETYGNSSAQHELDLDVPSIAADVTLWNGTVDTVTKIERSYQAVVVGQTIAGTLSTTQCTTDLGEGTTDHYRGAIFFLTGPLTGQFSPITGYDGPTKKFTYRTLTEAPGVGVWFVVQ